jgi:predicted  nucleic acid-binding Zn-ribbon protein
MESHRRHLKFKDEWKMFWESLFDKRRKPKKKMEKEIAHQSVSWLSHQRQRLHQRLEEIEFELKSLAIEETATRDQLHDEAQAITEKIEGLTREISSETHQRVSG